MVACHTASSSPSPQIRAKGLHSIIPLTSVDMSAVCGRRTRLVASISVPTRTTAHALPRNTGFVNAANAPGSGPTAVSCRNSARTYAA